MRAWKFVGPKTVTPGNPLSFDAPAGRFIGVFCLLTGTTDTAQTLAADEIGTLSIQRNGTIIQSRSFEFYHNWMDLHRGFPEATLPTAGATSIVCFIPFYVPRLPNSMEVRKDDELKIILNPDSGLSTEFGANAITFEVFGIEDKLIPEIYELHVRSQDYTASSTGKKTITLSIDNIAMMYLESTVVSTVQLDIDDRTVLPSIDLDVLNYWANAEYQIEATGNSLVPVPTGSRSMLGSYLNTSSLLYPTFSSTGDLDITLCSIQPSPDGVNELSAARVNTFNAQAQAKANRKLAKFKPR